MSDNLVAGITVKDYNLSRKTDRWKEKLMGFIMTQQRTPFQWDHNDCVSFATNCIMAMTGIDVVDWLRGKYYDKHTAKQALWGHMGMGLVKTFSKIFEENGFKRTDQINIGDICFVEIQNLDPEASRMFGNVTMAVVVNRSGHIMAPGKNGLEILNKYKLVKAWTL